jgi:hypothetical protein
VITDQCRVYDAALRQFTGMEHRTVSPFINFVDLNDTNTHRQQIEGFGHIKRGMYSPRHSLMTPPNFKIPNLF